MDKFIEVTIKQICPINGQAMVIDEHTKILLNKTHIVSITNSNGKGYIMTNNASYITEESYKDLKTKVNY